MDIYYLILDAGDFIVCLDSDLDVDWRTSEKYDENGHKDPAEQNAILNLAASLECIPNDHHKKNVRLNFKRMIGEGVARSLDNDYEGARNIIEKARLYIADRNIETARYWQLLTACALGLLSGFSGLALWVFRAQLIRVFGDSGHLLLLSGMSGSLGAILSMAFRMGHSFPTSEAPRSLHILEAASRVFAGCLSGVLMAGSIKIGLILPIFKDAGQTHLLVLVAAMASGASERWAPSLIARIEGSPSEERSKKGKTK